MAKNNIIEKGKSIQAWVENTNEDNNSQEWLENCDICHDVKALTSLKGSLLLEIYLLYNKGLSAREIFNELQSEVDYKSIEKVTPYLPKQSLIFDICSLYVKGLSPEEISAEINGKLDFNEVFDLVNKGYSKVKR